MGNDYGMQYIMDGNGNYYTVDSSNQLIVAKDREEASVFTFFEANQRIGGGKKSQFYQTIPVEDFDAIEQKMLTNGEERDDVEDVTVVSKFYSIVDKVFDTNQDEEGQLNKEVKTPPEFEYSMQSVDWSEFVNYFIFVASSAKGYQEELAKKHSDIEKEICDLLHYVELFDLSDDEGIKAMDMIKDARQRRRDVKDELSRTEYFQKMLGTSANVARAKGFLSELKKLDTRKYFPRQLNELFDGMESRKTDRDLFRHNRDISSVVEVDGFVYEEEEQEMSFVGTVFDNKKNDWLSFAREQMEFYQSAGQYMINLKIKIEAIDVAIEAVMEQIEDANYNVAQGYKVFKELKELRNERKSKAQELDILKTMTECFDMNSMAEAMTYNFEEIERITVTNQVEYVEQAEAV